MKLKIVLAALVGILVLAWSGAERVPVEPTPNYDATVEARVAQERAVDATVGARAKELVAAEQIIEEFQNESHARGLLAQSGYPDWWRNKVDIVGRAKADTTRRFRQHEIAEYLLVKISHDRPDYGSIGYVVDRIDKDGYVIESQEESKKDESKKDNG